jgi:hypothetical protein
MSHFTVLVIGKNPDTILEPYAEDLECEPYIDQTAEQIMATFKEQKKKYKETPEEKRNKFEKFTLTLRKPNAEWVKDWSGQTLDKDGNTLTTYNPDSKWDWYVIGGRWRGSLKLRPGATGKQGKPDMFDKDAKTDPTMVDQCRICDVDWNWMHNQTGIESGERWDAMFEPYDPKKCWFKPEYVEKQKKLHLDLYGTREEYMRRRSTWTTFALVSIDGWIEPGQMGWFGMSSDTTESREAFEKRFVDTIKSFPPETMITVMDCHI